MVTGHDPDLLTITEAARLLRVSPVTLQRWLRQGRLPAYHVGPKSVRIRRADLQSVVTPFPREEVGAMPELAPSTTTFMPLSDADIARQVAALRASAELLAQQAARRGGKPFDDSWPLIRAAHEERARQQT